jgi:hypothetical protein
LLASPLEPNRLYLLEGCIIQSDIALIFRNWLMVSSDGGVTWQAQPATIEGRTVQVVPSPVVAGRLYVMDEIVRWMESDDNGAQWVNRDFPVNILVPDAQNSSLLYGFATRDGPPYHRWGMRSEDGGEQWVEWAQQPCISPEGMPDLLAHLTTTKVLFLRCENGLFRSDNGGDAWTKLSAELGQLLAFDYGVPGRILWAKDDGLWASIDQGESWRPLMLSYALSLDQPQIPLYLPSVTAGGP